jgi:hypothetical protein
MKQLEIECKKAFDNWLKQCIKNSDTEETVVMRAEAFIAGFELGSNATASMLLPQFYAFLTEYQDKVKEKLNEHSLESNFTPLYH